MGPVRGALRAARTGFLAPPQAIASASAAGFGFTCRGQPPVAALSLCPSTLGGPTGELAQHAAPLRAVSNVGYTSRLNSWSRTPSFFRGRARPIPPVVCVHVRPSGGAGVAGGLATQRGRVPVRNSMKSRIALRISAATPSVQPSGSSVNARRRRLRASTAPTRPLERSQATQASMSSVVGWCRRS